VAGGKSPKASSSEHAGGDWHLASSGILGKTNLRLYASYVPVTRESLVVWNAENPECGKNLCQRTIDSSLKSEPELNGTELNEPATPYSRSRLRMSKSIPL
jgi:hypothetical protein